jgi:hypothetical protein
MPFQFSYKAFRRTGCIPSGLGTVLEKNLGAYAVPEATPAKGRALSLTSQSKRANYETDSYEDEDSGSPFVILGNQRYTKRRRGMVGRTVLTQPEEDPSDDFLQNQFIHTDVLTGT